MDEIRKWKRRIARTAEAHEQIMTGALLGAALLLALIAVFGRAHHKAAACLYILL